MRNWTRFSLFSKICLCWTPLDRVCGEIALLTVVADCLDGVGRTCIWIESSILTFSDSVAPEAVSLVTFL